SGTQSSRSTVCSRCRRLPMRPYSRSPSRPRQTPQPTPKTERMSDDNDLIGIGEPGSTPEIGVYGAPRPAVPERVPLAPRTKGCASGAGSLGSVEPGEFRRLPPWLKIQLPGTGEYAE